MHLQAQFVKPELVQPPVQPTLTPALWKGWSWPLLPHFTTPPPKKNATGFTLLQHKHNFMLPVISTVLNFPPKVPRSPAQPAPAENCSCRNTLFDRDLAGLFSSHLILISAVLCVCREHFPAIHLLGMGWMCCPGRTAEHRAPASPALHSQHSNPRLNPAPSSRARGAWCDYKGRSGTLGELDSAPCSGLLIYKGA